MPLFTPSGKQVSLYKLMAMSTLISPTHGSHMRPLIQAGGGDASSDIPDRQWYLCHAIQECLRGVYDSLRGSDHLLTRQKFEAWLFAVQGQTIASFEKNEYKFEEFLEAVAYNRCFEILKDIIPEQKDLTRPLSNYYISSSHNTYLSGNQLSSRSSTESYKNVLIRGCRCIEIDVHNGELPPDDKSNGHLSPRSSHSPNPPDHRPDHKRHISGSTLSSRAAAALEKVEEKYDKTKKKLLGRDHSGGDERGRKDTTSSLEVGNSVERAASIRSMMNGEPLVLHGWTLTAPVGFRAVCKTIRETAFVTSKFPIIVSLEVHADLEQQEVMVDIMKEEWKGLLVDEAHSACNPDERLPRLEELLNKILIKVKKAADKPDSAQAGGLAPVQSHTDRDSIHSGSEDERGGTKKKVKICDNLSNLGIYTHSEHFVSFEAKSAKKPPHVFSIGESQILELYETKRKEMLAHNRDFFMRAYPAGFRIDSSNLDPSVYWRKGVQMVALNWQNVDAGMMLNEGMFAGEHGWVLKPPGYRSDPTEPIQYKTLDLTITIFAGQHIPIPQHTSERNFHPYVRCELHVEKQDQVEPVEKGGRGKEFEYKHKTPYQTGDHLNFRDNGCELTFPTIPKIVEELSFLRFKIEDAKYAKDSLAAWACVRLDRLQQGYRFVHLLDAKGHATSGLLLVKIEKRLSLLTWGEGKPCVPTVAKLTKEGEKNGK